MRKVQLTISFAQKRVHAIAGALAFAATVQLVPAAALAADPAQPQAAKPAQSQASKPAQPQAAKPAQPQAVKPFQQQAAQPQQPAQQQAGGQQQINKLTEAVIKAGISKCANRVNQFTNFLTQQSSGFGAVTFMPPSNPNAQLFSSSLEINSATLPTAYASASFAPSEAGCGGMYETVIYWPNACNDVFKAQFTGMKQIGTLSKGIPILGGNGNARVFLMAAGTGCVSIKKEVVW